MSKSSRSFWAFVVGAAAGAIVGILYAPDKGENTRNKLYYQLNKYRDQLKQLINDMVDGKEVIETTAKSEGKKSCSRRENQSREIARGRGKNDDSN